MTSGQGTEIHFNDAALNASGVRLVEPVRSDKRILKSQRDGNALAVASAAQRYPVAVDFDILRPVQKYVHAVPPTPAFMFGIAQRTSQKSGSRLTERNPRYSRCIPTRPNGHPPQRTPDPHAQLLRRVSLSVSRAPTHANGDAGTLAPRHPTGVADPSTRTLKRTNPAL